MVVEIVGVVNVEPVPNDAPPVAAAYQLIVAAAFASATKVTVPVPHRVASVVAVIAGFKTSTKTVLEFALKPLVAQVTEQKK